MIEYNSTQLKKVVNIEEIVTIHYFEFAKDYVFQGEKHDFWEFLYVDRGQVEILAENKGYKLLQGDIVFHKPNEFHAVWANGIIAPNIVVISFYCNSDIMKFFEHKILKLSNNCKRIIGEIIKEGKKSFSNMMKPHVFLERSREGLFGGEQIIKMDLERLLIEIIREDKGDSSKERSSSRTKERMEMDLVDRIVLHLNENIEKNYMFDDICRDFSISSTQLKTLFKNKMNMGVMSYFRERKIEESKRLIREENLNFTEIAEALGFGSIHHFSSTFKKIVGMTPSEYAHSIKVIGLV